MKWKKWLENWDMTSLKIKTPFLEMDWNPQEADKNAAWDMYIELLTRITTQPLAEQHGDENTALDSIYSLFPITRQIIKDNGRDCIEFTKIAIIILNQKIRPFTAKWHKLSLEGAFKNEEQCKIFRQELRDLQNILSTYSAMLADMADVENLTKLEA
jgi:hypothetical protein